MQVLRHALEMLLDKRDLAEPQAFEVMTSLGSDVVHPAVAGALLAALRAKGVTADELRGFALAMRKLARRPELPPGVRGIDIVGTGGDASGSLNISTGTALLTAACGVPVLKHGNRSVSSRTGSADVLAQLGLPMPLDAESAKACFAATNFTFFFAPHYHPAMKAIAPIRAALGVQTIFNILGPLTNPAEPPFQLIGAFSLPIAELMAKTLAGMSIERAFVIHGSNGWDEPTPAAPFTVFDVRPGRIERQLRSAADYGLHACSPEALAGGDAAHNAAALTAVFEQRAADAHLDCLLLGTALALEVTGRSSSHAEAIALARAAIESGKAAEVLHALARIKSAAGVQ
jgi:anthranilate phosphoribosyltransferase